MAGALSRRNLFKIGGGVAAAGVGASLAAQAQAQEVAWQSDLVSIGADGMLSYHAEPFSGKKIPDFSWAGYRNGESPIPDVAEVPLRATDVPIVKTIGPLIGQDNTAHLQAALDEVGSMPMQENGFRGALLLNPGLYEVAKTVFMQRSGVVLRGSSRSADPGVGTIIRSTATAGAEDGGVECPLWVGGKAGGWEADVKDPVTGMPIPVKDTATNVTSDRVPAGSRRLTLPAPSTA